MFGVVLKVTKDDISLLLKKMGSGRTAQCIFFLYVLSDFIIEKMVTLFFTASIKVSKFLPGAKLMYEVKLVCVDWKVVSLDDENVDHHFVVLGSPRLAAETGTSQQVLLVRVDCHLPSAAVAVAMSHPHTYSRMSERKI